MKNTLLDLNNHLFAQLESVRDESVTGDKLKEEFERARSVGGIAKIIVSNAQLVLQSEELKLEYANNVNLPKILNGAKDEV